MQISNEFTYKLAAFPSNSHSNHFFLHNLQRLATRALRAADRESVRDRDDYALVRRNEQL
jgi:hypothetical protein